MIKEFRTFVGDFETSVYDGQKSTEVWASAIAELYDERVYVFNSIQKQLEYIFDLKGNIVIYYHNLKFDGMFWLDYFLNHSDIYKQAFDLRLLNDGIKKWKDDKSMLDNEYTYMISETGQFYSIRLKNKNRFIEFRDSLKLIPLSVKNIGKSYKTKHQKLDIEYVGERHENEEISLRERNYISNDVLVVKEALEIFYNEGHTKSTIGSNCLAEYKKICKHSLKNELEYKEMFPNLSKIKLNKNIHTYENADKWIRKSYKGGWCYVVKGKENKIFKDGLTADVNSLYPSMMHSSSGNRFPVGFPHFWKGEFPTICKRDDIYYFVRFKCKFYLKKNKLPTVQIKDNLLYKSTEWLETSDIIDKNGKSHDFLIDINNDRHECKPTLTLTKTDFILFNEHYNIKEIEIIDGCYFYTQIGIFDEYIDKYAEIKKKSKGGIRQIAKLFLNNLYGKLATSDDSSFKIVSLDEDGIIHFDIQEEHEKNTLFVACGSAITSYARNFTIRTAQKNYNGKNKKGFIYADTDSIHCDISVDQLKGVKIHSTEFNHWSIENEWDTALFIRQKTYIEHNIKEDMLELEKSYYNIKCAGMNQQCKDLLNASLTNDDTKINKEKLTEREKLFLYDENNNIIKRDITDFCIGLTIPSKLRPKRIKGGIILEKTDFTIR